MVKWLEQRREYWELFTVTSFELAWAFPSFGLDSARSLLKALKKVEQVLNTQQLPWPSRRTSKTQALVQWATNGHGQTRVRRLSGGYGTSADCLETDKELCWVLVTGDPRSSGGNYLRCVCVVNTGYRYIMEKWYIDQVGYSRYWPNGPDTKVQIESVRVENHGISRGTMRDTTYYMRVIWVKVHAGSVVR